MAYPLTQDLNRARFATEVTPRVRVSITLASGSVFNFSTETRAGTHHLISVQDTDGLFGESLVYLRAANSISVPIACIIKITDPEGRMFDTDFRGAQVLVKWDYANYRDSSGNVQSVTNTQDQFRAGPYFVFMTRNTFDPKLPTVELYCVSLWGILSMPAYRGTAGLFPLTGTIRNDIAAIMGAFANAFGSDMTFSDVSTDTELDRKSGRQYTQETPRMRIIQDLLGSTESYLRLEVDNSGVADWILDDYDTVDNYPSSGTKIIYDINGIKGQIFFLNKYDRTATLPTRIIAMKDIEDNNNSPFYDYDATAIGVFGDEVEILQLVENPEIATASEAQTITEELFKQYKDLEFQGELTALINPAQQPWDVVEVQLASTGLFSSADNKVGRVSRVVRRYNAQTREYHMDISLGRVKTPPQLTPVNDTDETAGEALRFSRFESFKARHNDYRSYPLATVLG